MLSVTEGNSFPSVEIENEDIYIWLDILGWSQAIENQTEYAKLYELLSNNIDKYKNNPYIQEGKILV